MPKTITRTRRVVMDVEDCCVCGVLFAMERSYIDRRRDDQAAFYCPNGHSQSYIESETDRLRATLSATQDQLNAATRRVDRLRETSRRERTRISKGTCPRLRQPGSPQISEAGSSRRLSRSGDSDVDHDAPFVAAR